MKTFSICTAIAVLAAAFAHAAPTYVTLEQRNSPPFLVQVTFQGAPPQTAFYTKQIPGDGSLVYLDNPLSISHIVSGGGASCVFFGIDGSQTTVVGAQTVDVGPPQTQIKGSCLKF